MKCVRPKVAIIIPVFNVEHYLVQTLESCIYQTYQDIEIIIVNDGSSDGSESIISHFSEQDPRIKSYKNIENKGTLQARVSGIEMTTADFALFLDGDDYLDLNAIDEIVNFASNQKKWPDLIEFGYEEIRLNGKKNVPKNIRIDVVESNLQIFCSTKWNMCFKFFKVSILKLAISEIDRGLILSRSEDLLQYYYVTKYAKSYITLLKPLYKYVIRNSYCYSTPITRAINDSHIVLNLIKSDMIKNGNFNLYSEYYSFNKHLRLASINKRHFKNYFKEKNVEEVELSLSADNFYKKTDFCRHTTFDFLNILPDKNEQVGLVFLPVFRLDLIFLSFLNGRRKSLYIYFNKKHLEKYFLRSLEKRNLIVNINRFSDLSFFVRLKTIGVNLLYKNRYFFKGRNNFINLVVKKIMSKYEGERV